MELNMEIGNVCGQTPKRADAVRWHKGVLQQKWVWEDWLVGGMRQERHEWRDVPTDIPYNETPLSNVCGVRVCNTLKHYYDIVTLEGVARLWHKGEFSDAILLRTPNFGRKSLNELKGALDDAGYL